MAREEMMQAGKVCTSTKFPKWTKQTMPVVDAIVEVLAKFKEHLPLTVRQVFYQLVAALVIRNHISQYRKVSRILVQMREREVVPYSAIEDRMRYTIDKRGVTDLQTYLEDKLEWFEPHNYGRCYLQHQSVYCEVSTEKNALSSILSKYIWPYCTRLNVIIGQSSATQVQEISCRLDAAIMRGQRPILLHFGDLDPSGVAIPRAVQKNFERRHGIEVDVRQVALTPEQVIKYNLPISLDAVKRKDPNYKAWLEEFGPAQPAVELDALSPGIMHHILKTELEAVYNTDGMNDEAATEIKERQLLGRIRQDIHHLLHDKYGMVI